MITDKIEPGHLDKITVSDTVEVTGLLIKFLMALGNEIGLLVSDIVETLGISAEKNPKIVQARQIASSYAFYSENEKIELKNYPEYKNLNFELIEKYSTEFLEKAERYQKAPEKFLTLISTVNKENPVYIHLVEFLFSALKYDGSQIEKEILFNSGTAILIELFLKASKMPDDEVSQAFFLIRFIKAILKNIPLFNFISTSLKNMQTE